MANEEQHESISKLLTDTVTLLCRNSLPHTRDLKVQGLLAITTDDTDVFIVQINERFAKKTGARFTAVNNDFTEQQQAPPMAQQSAGRVMSGMRGMGMSRGGKMASRRGAIMRKTPQSAPNRIQLNMPPDSPASLAARVKARQQLNFQSPQKRICLQGAGYSPGVKQEAGRGGGAPAAMRATPPRNVGPEAANRMKSPRGGMAGQRTPSRAMQPKSEPMDIPAQDNSMALCVRPVKKEVPVKKEGKGDVICVLSDDEGEHRPTSRHTNQTEDSKAAALEAIMQQALNEVRTTSSNIGSSSGFDGNSAGNAGSYSTDQTHGGFDDVKPFVSSSTWGNSKMMGMAWDGGQQQQRPKIPTQMPTTPVQMKVEGHSFSVASMVNIVFVNFTLGLSSVDGYLDVWILVHGLLPRHATQWVGACVCGCKYQPV